MLFMLCVGVDAVESFKQTRLNTFILFWGSTRTHRFFHPHEPSFPPARTDFSTRTHRVFHPHAPSFPPARTEFSTRTHRVFHPHAPSRCTSWAEQAHMQEKTDSASGASHVAFCCYIMCMVLLVHELGAADGPLAVTSNSGIIFVFLLLTGTLSYGWLETGCHGCPQTCLSLSVN